MLLALVLAPTALLDAGPHHTRHLELLGRGLPRVNREVLAAVDRVQATAMDGGGYFIGVKAVPAECPIGYPLRLKGAPILAPTRTTSYCSGSSYSAFIEAMDRLLKRPLDPARLELMRMQEPDGGRREDEVKAWGWWNADGFGCDFALVQYLGVGERIKVAEARPGDFMNVSWASGLGHSVVFLGWAKEPGEGREHRLLVVAEGHERPWRSDLPTHERQGAFRRAPRPSGASRGLYARSRRPQGRPRRGPAELLKMVPLAAAALEARTASFPHRERRGELRGRGLGGARHLPTTTPGPSSRLRRSASPPESFAPQRHEEG